MKHLFKMLILTFLPTSSIIYSSGVNKVFVGDVISLGFGYSGKIYNWENNSQNTQSHNRPHTLQFTSDDASKFPKMKSALEKIYNLADQRSWGDDEINRFFYRTYQGLEICFENISINEEILQHNLYYRES